MHTEEDVADGADVAKLREHLQRAMIEGTGVVRSPDSLVTAAAEVGAVAGRLRAASAVASGNGHAVGEPADLVTVAGALLQRHLARQETRGAHARRDFPRRERCGAAASSIAPWPRRGCDRRHRRHRGQGRDRTGAETSRRCRSVAMAGGVAHVGPARPSRRSGPRRGGPRPGRGPGPARGPHRHARARHRGRPGPVVSHAEGVLAGRLCALEAYAQVDTSLVVDFEVSDGAWLAPGSVVAEVSGPMRSILTAERTALNFLCHLSGVATVARRYVDTVCTVNPATRVLDTRKTTPGLRALEKAAVHAGGAWNHRAGLSDAVLVKDNHLGSVTIGDAVATARRWWPGRMVEVACDHPEQVADAVAAARRRCCSTT